MGSQYIPCFLCGDKLEKRLTKHGKPYFVCDPCGIQLFVRGKKGVQSLDHFFHQAAKAQIPFQQCIQELCKLQALLLEIDGVKQEITKIGSFFLDEEQKRKRKLLKMRLETLFAELEHFAKANPKKRVAAQPD